MHCTRRPSSRKVGNMKLFFSFFLSICVPSPPKDFQTCIFKNTIFPYRLIYTSSFYKCFEDNPNTTRIFLDAGNVNVGVGSEPRPYERSVVKSVTSSGALRITRAICGRCSELVRCRGRSHCLFFWEGGTRTPFFVFCVSQKTQRSFFFYLVWRVCRERRLRV